MNCFVHSSSPAIGICKSCGRGLCHECAADVGNGLACKGQCEDRVRTINLIIDANPRTFSVANRQLRLSMFMSIAAGLVFAAFGLIIGLGNNGLLGVIFVLLGAIFLVRGSLTYRKSARYPVLSADQTGNPGKRFGG